MSVDSNHWSVPVGMYISLPSMFVLELPFIAMCVTIYLKSSRYLPDVNDSHYS